MTVPPETGEGSYPQLQGRSQQQLGFVNNVLITLALAVLAFAVNESSDPSKISTLGWRRYVFGVALILLAVSLLGGLALSLNRLQVFRIDARIVRLRELISNLVPSEHYDLYRIAYVSRSLERWSRVARFTRRKERSAVGNPARRVAEMSSIDQDAVLSTDEIALMRPEVQNLILSLRKWSDKADEFTWILFRLQTLCFLIAATLILVSTAIYFYH